MTEQIGSERWCPVCHKRFFIRFVDQWGWIAAGRQVCGYKCMRAWERGEVSWKEVRGGQTQAAQRQARGDEALRLREAGFTFSQIMMRLGYRSQGSVCTALKYARLRRDEREHDRADPPAEGAG